MKRISFFLALALIIASFGLATASSVTIESTTGIWTDTLGVDWIIPNGPVTFDLRFTNDQTQQVKGFTAPFVIYGTSSYTPAVGDTLLAGFTADWDLGLFINHLSANGSGADTVNIGGAVIFGPGMPAGFSDVVARISSGGVAEGEELCIDSLSYPSQPWKWVYAAPIGDVFPDFGGPFCYTAAVPPCLPPVVNNAPTSLNGSHCDVITFDFNADAGSEDHLTMDWSADIGTIDANGVWSYSPSLTDVGTSMSVTVTATQQCGGDATVNLVFTNEAPVIVCPTTTLDVGNDLDTDVQLSASDDCDPFSWSIVTGAASIDANGLMTLSPTVAGLQTIVVEVSDGNASTTCDFVINAIDGELFQVEIPCLGAPEGPIFQGQHALLPINLNTNNIIDGYDLLIGYDNSALSFQTATPGADLVADGWEYFTYRYGANGNCSNACPTGLLRLTAIAETNNGPNHPTLDGVTELAVLDFLVTNDRTLECQEIPVRFYWMDCGDNTLSADGGNELHVSNVIFDGDEVLSPPNGLEIQNFDYGFPTYFGTQNSCIVPVVGKPTPLRDASFNNGCLFIACADAIDLRGDLNLNNVANEIGDAVLYSNYFIYGIGTFIINTEGQIAASDVNADGLALSVADLVYLIRIVVGDANPYPKTSPEAVNATIVESNNVLSVDATMGAALVVIEGNVVADLRAENMEMISNFDGVNTRVLVYSLEGNTFSGEFLNANGTVISTELASATGSTVNAKLIPGNFELAQNYPNPFNPSTTVGFSIPFQSDVTLTIYNVTGQKVAEFSGAYTAGFHSIEWDASANASGIYFYKLDADNFAETKKMVLLK